MILYFATYKYIYIYIYIYISLSLCLSLSLSLCLYLSYLQAGAPCDPVESENNANTRTDIFVILFHQ
jgi:hypothetical protein